MLSSAVPTRSPLLISPVPRQYKAKLKFSLHRPMWVYLQATALLIWQAVVCELLMWPIPSILLSSVEPITSLPLAISHQMVLAWGWLLPKVRVSASTMSPIRRILTPSWRKSILQALPAMLLSLLESPMLLMVPMACKSLTTVLSIIRDKPQPTLRSTPLLLMQTRSLPVSRS